MGVPLYVPALDGNEARYLEECIRTGWISSEGPFVRRFEEAFAGCVGVAHGVAVSSGTAALEAALYAAGVGEGDEVIVPTSTIISCAIAVIRRGATPVFVDIDHVSWTMDPGAAAGQIGPRTRAIMPVHIFGHAVDMDPLLELAEKHGLVVVEDAAQAHGAEYRSRRRGRWLRCGAMGHVAATSFYANKIVSTGEGGMVLTDDGRMAERAASFRNLCFKPERRFFHTDLGYNLRMSNLQAAVGLAQVERIDHIVERKRCIAGWYSERLARVGGLRFMQVQPWARSVYWMYAVQIDAGGPDAHEVIARLAEASVGARPFFLGMHRQPALKDRGLAPEREFPNADAAYRGVLYLPSSVGLTEAQVDHVVEAVAKAVQR